MFNVQPEGVGARYFYYRAVENKAETKKQGRPVYKDILYYKDTCPGDRNTVIDMPVNDDWKREILSMDQREDIMGLRNLLERFLSGEGQKLEGTPIEQWPQVAASQVATLKYHRVYTVEQLSQLPDDFCERMGTGYLNLKHCAKEYFENAKKTALSNEKNAEIEALREELATLKAMMVGEESRKPGRPKKEA